jgi:hypothetical protein
MNIQSIGATRIVGAIALLLIVGLGWQFVLSPKTEALSDVRDEITDTRDSNDLLALQLVTLKRQAEELDSVRATAGALSAMFPATADQPRLFREVTDAAADAGIGPKGVTALSPTPPVVGGGDPAAGVAVDTTGLTLARQTVAVAVEGSYAETQRLLANLEQIPRAFLITSVSLSSGTEKGDYTTTVTGDMFVMPPVVDPADAGDNSDETN